jgi:hypothetical protein
MTLRTLNRTRFLLFMTPLALTVKSIRPAQIFVLIMTLSTSLRIILIFMMTRTTVKTIAGF